MERAPPKACWRLMRWQTPKFNTAMKDKSTCSWDSVRFVSYVLYHGYVTLNVVFSIDDLSSCAQSGKTMSLNLKCETSTLVAKTPGWHTYDINDEKH